MLSDTQKSLSHQVEIVLDGSLGLNILPLGWNFQHITGNPKNVLTSSIKATLLIFVLYAVPFCLVVYIFNWASDGAAGNTDLALLQLYGALWASWSTFSTRLTSASIEELLTQEVIPLLSDKAARRILHNICISFRRSTVRSTSWALGVTAGLLAMVLIYSDLGCSRTSIGGVFWWGLGWVILFTTSANVVNTSRLYMFFTAGVETDSHRLFPLDPARSAIILSLNLIAQRMLLFWLGISVSIGCIIPFALKQNPRIIDLSNVASFVQGLSRNLFVLDIYYNNFVVIYIASTSLFSIGVGTFVFLRHEARIRRAVRAARLATLIRIDRSVAESIDDLDQIEEAKQKRLKELRDFRSSLIAAGSYRSLLISGLSLLLPFVPLISFLAGKVGK